MSIDPHIGFENDVQRDAANQRENLFNVVLLTHDTFLCLDAHGTQRWKPSPPAPV